MSCCQNVTLSDELMKWKTKLAVEHECLREEEEEEEEACEAAEAWRQPATVLQQQARENWPCVELPQWSVLPVVSRSGASGSLSRCMSSLYSNVSHGASHNDCCS